MGVIVVVYAAFGLTKSEAETEIMSKQTKMMPEATTIFSVEAASQVYNQTNGIVCLGGNVVNQKVDRSVDVDRRIPTASYSFSKYILELYDR